jgi:hypothetical protein
MLAEILVSASDSRSVTVEYKPVFTRQTESEDAICLQLHGGDNIYSAGKPILPVYYAYIAVPPASEPVVRLINRTPGKLIQGKLKVYRPVESDENESNQIQYIPDHNEVVGNAEAMSLAGIKVLRVPIYPANINSQNETIEIAEQVKIRVDFNQSKISPEYKQVKLSNFQNKLVVNAEQAMEWGRYQTSNFDEASWPKGFLYRFQIDEENIYSLTYDELIENGVELPANGIASTNIKLFGNGGGELPLDPGDPAPLGLVECAIYVDDGNDDVFQSGDRIIFYGRGVGGWVQDRERSWRYDINHYENYNYYWLNIDPSGGGARMSGYQEETIPDIFSETGIIRRHVEPERFIYNNSGFVGSGRNWYGYTFDGVSSTSYYIDLANPDTSAQARLSVKVDKPSGSTPEIEIVVNGDSIAVIAPGFINDPLNPYEIPVNIGSMLLNGRNTIKLTQTRTGNQALFDWLDLESHCILNQPGAFEGIDYTGYVEYKVSDVSNCWLFDITDHNNVGLERDSTVLVYQRLPYTHRYYIANVSNLVEVTSPFKEYFPPESDIDDLFSVNNSADVLIFAPDGYWDELELLVENYQNREQHLTAKRIRLSEAYDHFSGGLMDPGAIRNLIHYAVDYWMEPPQYVLLCGDGDYNYRNIDRPANENYLPPFEELSICSDDWFVDFTAYADDRKTIPVPDPEMAIARITASNRYEVRAAVDKIIGYTEEPEYGPWRNRITIVADDEFGDDHAGEYYHISDSEKLCNQYIPDYIQKEKLYLSEYERTWGRQKPQAGDDLVEMINNGTLLVNYMGHGNPTLWAHEYVFVLSRDLQRIEPSRRLPVYIAFTCDWAYWDDPTSQSFPEQLLTLENRGAIACIAATRPTYGNANFDLAKNFFQCIFSDHRDITLGEALALSKRAYQNSNSSYYHLLGDPALQLALPKRTGEITSMPMPLLPLDISSVSGQVQNSIGTLDPNFSGQLEFQLIDTEVRKHYQSATANNYYNLSGPVIYRGLFSIDNGVFNGQFVVPRDVSLGDSLGKVIAYFNNDEIDGVIALDSVSYANQIADRVDFEPPSIDIYVGSRAFRQGDLVGPEPLLIINLTDSSGLNLTGAMGHGVQFILDGGKPADLTSYFRYNLNSYQSGSLEKKIGPLSAGEHTIEVQAWDSFNNIGSSEIEIEVTDASDGFTVERVLNYPNPSKGATELTFRVTGQISEYEIRIFTVGGREIQDYRGTVVDNTDYVRNIYWNGHDRDGRVCGNGVYLYKVIAWDDSGNRAEGLGRIALIR